MTTLSPRLNFSTAKKFFHAIVLAAINGVNPPTPTPRIVFIKAVIRVSGPSGCTWHAGGCSTFVLSQHYIHSGLTASTW